MITVLHVIWVSIVLLCYVMLCYVMFLIVIGFLLVSSSCIVSGLRWTLTQVLHGEESGSNEGIVGLIDDDGEMGGLLVEEEGREREGSVQDIFNKKHISSFSVMYYVTLPAFLFTVPIFAVVG